MKQMDYNEATEYILSIPRFAAKTHLDNTRAILSKLGNPENKFKSIHVAGTNGKGSVCKMLALALEEQGYKVGLFTSPHLMKMNERISINGIDISDEDFTDIFNRVKSDIDVLLDSDKEVVHPAFFEYVFLMAALYFAEQNCDYVVLETGLGGRLDATSVVTPEVCIITSIGMDHMQYLGNTIEEIAGEKAGIIVPGVPVIYNTGSYVADKVIEEKAGKLVSPAYNVVKYKDGVLKLLGEESTAGFKALYQIDNAVTATLAFMMMQEKDELDVTDMKKALAKFSWPGRMQYLAPNIIMDGAHNEDAIKRFVESVKSIAERDGWKKMSLLFAVSSDKDYEDIISILTRELTFEDIYVGELASDRKLDASKVVELFQKYSPAEKHFSIVGTKNIEDAWRLATGELEEDTLLLIVGSLYMVGEIEKLIGKE